MERTVNSDLSSETESSFSFYCWAASDVGSVRNNNEDAFLTSGQLDGEADIAWEGRLDVRPWALVADGMGGHAAGEVASALAVECLSAVLPGLATADEVSAAIEATNLALHDAMRLRPDLRGMGTTVAGILALRDSAIVFNVGDSRIYLAGRDGLARLSEDHVVGGYLLTKCLGGTPQIGTIEPFVRQVELTRGSRFLLCTDGLTDELEDEEIVELIAGHDPASTLVGAALEKGGRDNVTVVVVQID
jgi:serine/threonine protein phosphatase PrpC